MLRLLIMAAFLTATLTHAVHAAVVDAVPADFLTLTQPALAGEATALPYRLLLPVGYDPANSYPLIMWLHGNGQKGNDNTAPLAAGGNIADGAIYMASAFNRTNYPCFVLVPQCWQGDWMDDPVPAQMVRLLGQLEQQYSIDRNRICITGLSMGGWGTNGMVCKYPFVFACAMPLSGWASPSEMQAKAFLPMWFGHADPDGTVGINGSTQPVETLRGIGRKVIFSRHTSGGHSSSFWGSFYSNPALMPWIMAQRRNQPMAGTPTMALDITTPSAYITAPPGQANTTISGNAALSAITKVSYTFTWWTGASNTNTGNNVVANGTTSWTTGLITNASPNAGSMPFLAIAEAPNPAGGGTVTISDARWIANGAVDMSSPSVAVTVPTSTGSITTTAAMITLSGTSAAQGTKSVSEVRWSSNNGSQSYAVGTTAWTIEDIDLLPGVNLITVSVRDSALVESSVTYTITRNGGSGNTAPTISAIANQTVTIGGTTGAVAVVINDAETAAASLSVTSSSSNTTLVPQANVVLGGSGSNRTVTVTPTAGQTGTATITVTVSDGTATTNTTFIITVAGVVPAISAQPGNKLVTVGQTATFTVAASGNPAPTFQWQKNGINIAGATAASYITPATVLADNGAAFRCVARNSAGSATSNSATLSVTAPSGGPAGYTWCAAENGSFTFSQRVDVAYGGGGKFAYKTGVIGTIVFNNATFGDPFVGGAKAGYYRIAPWTNRDIGTTGVAGNASQDANGTWTITGSGTDVWLTADSFQHVSQPLSGDGQIVARVVSQTGSDPWAKAGVMIRENTTAGSRHAFMAATPGNGMAFQRRLDQDGNSSHTGGAFVTAPYWVKLTRVGNVFTGYQSADGTTWTVVGTATITMGSNVLIGLGITAHNNATTSTAVFDNVIIIATPHTTG